MDKFNLEIRLAIILLVIFALGISAAVIRFSTLADEKISQEVSSVTELVNRMLSISELGNESPFNPETEPAFLQELIALENIRHIDIRIQSTSVDYPQVNENSRSNINAPDWFVAIVYPTTDTEIRTFRQSNGDLIGIYADPRDEIEGIWVESRNRIFVTFVFLLLMMLAIMFAIHRWMKPLQSVIGVLDNVELGDFSRRIPTFSLPEFREIGDRINQLTTSLGYSNSENERLIRKSIAMQERERRHLAQELHDSLGQAVSAIKAIAVSIEERLKQTDSTSAARAKNIEEIADSAYDSVRDLMTSLRPSVLDELGLNEALKQMADDWNVHHEDTFCRLRIEGDFSTLHEEQQINIYRIVQEALTNISKYARAENVFITLSGSEILTLQIIDDGVGFAMNKITQSMGMTGIKDRATLLQGTLEIDSKPGKGVTIQIEFPSMELRRRRISDQ